MSSSTSPLSIDLDRESLGASGRLKRHIEAVGFASPARYAVRLAARPTYRLSLRVVPNREELPEVLNRLGLTGCGVELGVARGVFSAHLLRHWRGAHLISVDPWAEQPRDGYVDVSNAPQPVQDRSYEEACERLTVFGRRSSVWRMFGAEAAERIPRGSLDFVYVDARHDYESVRDDLRTWFPLLRPGAIFAGHDYNDGTFAEGEHGVASAVDEFFGSLGIEVHQTRTDAPSRSWMVSVPRAGETA